MLEELRLAAARQRAQRLLRQMKADSQRLLSEQGELDGLAVARALVARLQAADDDMLDAYFEHLATALGPDPAAVLRAAQAFAADPQPATLQALTGATEPPRQELLRRLNRAPGGTAAILRLRRRLLRRLPERPALQSIEADLRHLLSSWFNPGFLRMQRVNWDSPARLLEKIIQHEAVHSIDGWDDLRRRLRPDRRCFAFFHPQLPDEPLIFVEVALLPAMPDAIAPLIDKASTPLPPERFRVAAFYSISNCERGLRGVSLGNFLIKGVAEQLQRELPGLRSFCTLSPIPGLAAWLQRGPDFAALARAQPQASALARRGVPAALDAARALLQARAGGDLAALQAPDGPAGQNALASLDAAAQAALLRLAAAYLLWVSPSAAGDPVARFHLDNGARLERLNLQADLSPKGRRQSYGLMVNYLYDLDRIEAHHAGFRRGEVAHARAVAALA